MRTFGRTCIYANYTEEQLLSGTPEQIESKVLDILNNSIGLHEKNNAESVYLQNYLYGDQDIKNKVKLTREEINNKSVENWAWAFQEWKKAFLLGKPIQYAPSDDKSNEEITILNNYVNYEDKDQKDQDIYEDIFTVGRGFRFIKYSKTSEDDEAPFDIINLDVLNTEVVYSSSVEHEQLLAFVKTSKKYITQQVNPDTGKKEDVPIYYDEYTVYTRNNMYIINNKTGTLQIINQIVDNQEVRSVPIIQNIHLITEYWFNRKRMSFLEICKDIFDDLNYVENLDLDDIEGFVNSIMVFTNAEVDKNGMDKIKQYGAVSIKSTDQKKASVELLQSRLKSLDTQIYYLRKLSALHSILSVPEANQSGDFSNAETGKAMLTGQGFTSASVRVGNEEKAFKKCDRNSLKVILKICRKASDSEIKNLKISNIDIKFSRDLSDNLLTKTQALMNLQSVNMPPQVANAVVGLFSDPTSVTKLQETYMKQRELLQNEINKQQNNVKEQNNRMQDIKQKENQGL